jgi:hypothetical protein
VTGPRVDLAPPPPDLSAFPTPSDAQASRELYRIFFHRNSRSGELTSPWRFGSVPPGASRFDLPVPHGTCYWSDRRYGAFVEVFCGARVVDRVDVTRRRLFAATPPPRLRLADTSSRRAYRFGISGELLTVVPYTVPQAWAQALHGAGFAGVIGVGRHDPALEARNVALFGPAGTLARRAGWRIRRTTLDNDPELASELAELGVRIAPVPYVVPTIAAPR